jgi:hypothetical protein
MVIEIYLNSGDKRVSDIEVGGLRNRQLVESPVMVAVVRS